MKFSLVRWSSGLIHTVSQGLTLVGLAMAIMMLLCLLLACRSEGDDDIIEYPVPHGNIPRAEDVLHAEFIPSPGSPGLNQVIFESDVIFRGKLKDTEAAAEFYRTEEDGSLIYRGLVKMNFDVHEYLKGNGGNELVAYAVLFFKSHVTQLLIDKYNRGEFIEWRYIDTEPGYWSMEQALEAAQKWEKDRDTRWDGREGILLLREEDIPGSSDGSKRYLLGAISNYSFHSRSKVWLPSADEPGSTDVSSGESSFLVEPPMPTPNGSSSDSASALSSAGPTSVNMSEIKALIAQMDKWLEDGQGDAAYLRCIEHSFNKQQMVNGQRERGESIYVRMDFHLNSGQSAGTAVTEGHPVKNRIWHDGRHKDLFEIPSYNNSMKLTTRPLPAGVYRVYHNTQPNELIPCNYIPTSAKNTREVFVTVTAPDGTLHEAFFDPVAINDDIGADASNGVLKPASYTSGGTTTTINSIEWGSQQVSLDATSSLPADHHIDFLALDASVALRLDVDDATATTSGGVTTHSWHVCNQPWSAGDKLMLRISSSSSDLTGVTNDEPCAAPTPEPTVEPSPTAVPTPTPVPQPPDRVVPTVTAGYGQLTASWDPPADNGSAITAYTVQSRHHPDGAWTVWATLGADARSSLITGLASGGIYRVRIRAQNGVGWGDYSWPFAEATPLTPQVPGQFTPTLNAGQGQLTASWTPPAENGSGITGYRVQYRKHPGGTWTVWATLASDARSSTITGLTAGATYRVRAQAQNAIGWGDYSWPLAEVTLP